MAGTPTFRIRRRRWKFKGKNARINLTFSNMIRAVWRKNLSENGLVITIINHDCSKFLKTFKQIFIFWMKKFSKNWKNGDSGLFQAVTLPLRANIYLKVTNIYFETNGILGTRFSCMDDSNGSSRLFSVDERMCNIRSPFLYCTYSVSQ